MNSDAWVSRGEASYLTGVSADAIGKWHARGWVDQAGQRRHLRVRRLGNGRLLYRVGDILDAERDTHLSGKGRRSGYADAGRREDRGERRVGRGGCGAGAAPGRVTRVRLQRLEAVGCDGQGGARLGVHAAGVEVRGSGDAASAA